MAIPPVALVILPAFYFSAVIIYRLFFHPLAKVPGPKLLAISSLPRGIRHAFYGLWWKDVPALHAKYGRVFRMGPDQIAVDGDPGWDDVFGFRRPGKDDFGRDRDFFDNSLDGDGGSSLFLSDRANHGRQRRVLSHAFSQSAMYEQEPLIKSYVDLFISRISDFAASNTEIDIVRWFRSASLIVASKTDYATFDIIGELLYSESFDCLASSEMHPWVATIFGALRASDIITFFKGYTLTRPLLKILLGKKIAAARADHKAFTKHRTDHRMSLGPEGYGKKDIMSHVLKHNDEKGMTTQEIHANAEALVVAGSETTATCLSGTIYYLGMNPPVMQRIVDEVRSNFTSEDEITIKSTMNLAYLQAVIEESLRVFPPAVVSPTRVSPGDFVGDYFIPKGTKVLLHQYASYRNPSNWHRPDEFCPQRFLPKDHPLYDASFAKDNRKSFYPFSHGPANCIGKNLAYSEMRIVLARLLWRFDIALQPGFEKWRDGMRAYTLWDKPPMMTKFVAVKR